MPYATGPEPSCPCTLPMLQAVGVVLLADLVLTLLRPKSPGKEVRGSQGVGAVKDGSASAGKNRVAPVTA